MPGEAYDVVIVGGGAVGICLADALARETEYEVVVVERDRIGSGSTGRAVGGVRQQFGDRLRTALMLDARQRFEEYARTFEDVEFRACGYLFLAQTDAEAAGFERSASMYRDLGLSVEVLDPENIESRYPVLRTDDVTLGRFCPSDGVTDPHTVTARVAARAERAGVTIEESRSVRSITTESAGGHQVATGVETDEGRLRGETVVVAAGVWTPGLCEGLGLALPITPTRIQAAVSEETDALGPDDPFIVDVHERRYLRWEPGPAVLVGGRNVNEQGPADPDRYDEGIDQEFLVQSAEFLEKRTRGLADRAIVNGWAGLKGVTPDGLPLVGPLEEVEGLYVAAGFNGHGFMLAPSIGECVAAHIESGGWRHAGHDLSPFDPDRFSGREDETSATGDGFMGAG